MKAQDDEKPHDFYLFLSEDLRPWGCRVVGRIRAASLADDGTIVDLDPPISAGIFGTRSDLRRVLLAPRIRGTWVDQVRQADVLVNLYILVTGDIDAGKDSIRSDELRLLEWGRIRCSPFAEDAVPTPGSWPWPMG